MITIECDNCERPFEVDPAGGDRVACPHCGDINRVQPERAQGHAARTRAAPQETKPSWPEGLPPDAGPEQLIRVVRPAMFRAHPFRGLAVLCLAAGGGVLAAWGLPAEETPRRLLGWLGVALAAAAMLWLLKWYVGEHLWVSLSISNKRTVRREGIIKRHTSEVLHDHVREVVIRQSFLQRIFNIGYLGISSSAQGGTEVEVRDIPAPYKVKALIDQYRNL